ncbi:hypothetical protein, variant 2 [Aphanomyces astaci]|uniref:Uncharacterized protein n=2 Tax=Aphanomyces astaci TaxID=112090 RepID=W4FSA1_APHAT|nr:hypothetical protein, variant 2 [Aphanomyces astaci]ETV69513.1 hypothetical protein, variant 2 [Aphanomyces astaci]|eukprot:XP_009841086.1 hypothetical protein, variant 2 [Aphanomyces astaci]
MDTITRILRDVETTINVSENGSTPLWIASKHGHNDVVRVLVDVAHAVDWVNDDGESALYAAAQEGHIHVLDTLLRHTNVNLANEDGATPLYIASEMGHVHAVQLLLAHDDVDVNQPNVNGATPLHVACERGHAEVVRLLLAVADCAVSDMDGWTALHAATCSGHANVVELLLASGQFDVSVQTNACDTALDLATDEGHARIAEMLTTSTPSQLAISPDHIPPCLWLLQPATGYNVYPLSKELLQSKQMQVIAVGPNSVQIRVEVAAQSSVILTLLPLFRTTLLFLTATALITEHHHHHSSSLPSTLNFFESLLANSPNNVVPGLTHAIAAMTWLHQKTLPQEMAGEMDQRLQQLVASLYNCEGVDIYKATTDLHDLWNAYQDNQSTVEIHRSVLETLTIMGNNKA